MRSLRLNPTMVFAGTGIVLMTVVLLVGVAQDRGAVTIDRDDIGGVVTGPGGPEAGVWVIAETTDLPTQFRKIVVTDDRGRYVVPDLPQASYRVWVRGYGLVDSAPVTASPGELVAHSVQAAPSERAAAEIYPASYWYSLIAVPDKDQFPMTLGSGRAGATQNPELRGPSRRGMQHQAEWINAMKHDCQLCHQLGTKLTREMPHNLGEFDSTVAAWDRRVKSGQLGGMMSGGLARFGRERALEMYADWTDRIAAGEVPPMPPRPQGVERNVVISLWDWAGPTGFVHDEIATDKRNTTVNANGPVYGVEFSNDGLAIVDPVHHTTRIVKVPTRDDPETIRPWVAPQPLEPSPYWGEERIWTNPANPHNPMMDHRGRVWMTSQVRATRPAYCSEGSGHPSADRYPLTFSSRQLAVYDPETDEVTLIDTCYNTHHLQFAEDDDNTLWITTNQGVVGWLNTRVFDETGDERAAQGWCPTVIDTNGDGTIGEYVGPRDPVDPALDKRIDHISYGIIPNPVDGSIWYAAAGVPGQIVRLSPGDNPPDTCIAEVYEPPFENPKMPGQLGYTPRGIDVDRNGLIWTALGGSAHIASFDRSQCAVLNGPNATGQHCPEGWKLYETPGPQMQNVTDPGNADFLYYIWVDQFDTFGLGRNVPIATGSSSDSLIALLPDSEEMVVLRVPYPLGFFPRGLDGRIDDPDAGWKGRGLWSNFATFTVWHIEGGKGTEGPIVKFQLRPDPLAK